MYILYSIKNILEDGIGVMSVLLMTYVPNKRYEAIQKNAFITGKAAITFTAIDCVNTGTVLVALIRWQIVGLRFQYTADRTFLMLDVFHVLNIIAQGWHLDSQWQ